MTPSQPDSRVVYLMYHELEIPGRRLCYAAPGYVRYIVFAEEFARQMQWIKSQNHRGISVDEALSSKASDSIVLTFDDGCETDLISAAPVLKQLGFGATFYITVGFLGKPGYLSRPQLRELSDQGFDMGCHSMTHPHLNDVPAEKLHAEIAVPKSELEQITGRAVHHFSCPGGRWDERIIEAAKQAGYHSVATSDARPNSRHADRFSLGRVAVMRNTSFKTFQDFCHGRGLWKIQLGFAVRARVKGLLGNAGYDRVRALLLNQTPRS